MAANKLQHIVPVEGNAMSLGRRAAIMVAAALVMAGSSITSASVADATTHHVSAKHLQAAHRPAKLNFRQISRGNFTSLRGRWVESAHGTNAYGGKGLMRGGPTRMSVSSKRIVAGSIVVRGRTLSDGQSLKRAKLVFTRQGKYLNAGLKNQEVAINYLVSFYPRGVPLRLFTSTNGVKISKKRNRIVIWTSNNSYTEVFSQK